jgi:hypothetical protein
MTARAAAGFNASEPRLAQPRPAKEEKDNEEGKSEVARHGYPYNGRKV